MRSVRWNELSTPRKLLLTMVACAQIALAASAWADLARRPASQINGSKRARAAVIAFNFVGPVLYFRRGRRAAPSATNR